MDDFARRLLRWYDANARELPWRQPGVSAWAVLVSEVMLQQTPAARVEPVWQQWMKRWPSPESLAATAAGDAVRAWGRLGYPRRALRLHSAAAAIVDRYGGEVPSSYDELRTLPGVGDCTAAAVAAFAFDRRLPVLDTNVRRVYGRVFDGSDDRSSAPTAAERVAAEQRIPARHPGVYSVAVMELGALVCTARAPRCEACPLQTDCRWHAGGRPKASRRRPSQRYEGTDRQARGRLLAVLRLRHEPVRLIELDVAWPDATQRARALRGLIEDGLVEAVGDEHYRLPV